MTGQIPHVLILAGRRDGDDLVARVAGVSHKAFAPVAGTPMLVRVARTLRQALPGVSLGIAIDAPDSADASPILAELATEGEVVVVPIGPTPCRTIAAALAMPNLSAPLLIVTADHPLLTPAMVHHFLAQLPPGIHAAAAVATRQTIAAAYPQTRRTYWRFSDCAISGCNLFYLGGDGAAKVVAYWQRLEQDRKRPWAMLRHLGLGTLLRFALGRLTLAAALDRLGRKAGAKVTAIDMPFAEAAIDVDRPGDLALADSILRQRP